MSFKLAVFSSFFWTCTAGCFLCGTFKLLSPDNECLLQSIVDLIMKCFYSQVLCSSHGAVLSPEGILMRLLILEESANAAFRQVPSTYFLPTNISL
jgi:hypothetical protein